MNVPAGVTGFTGLVLDTGVANGTLAGAGASNLTGNAVDNVLTGSTGNNVIDGLAGNDAVVFAGNYADYTLAFSGSNVTVTRVTGGSDVDTLTNMEKLQFADKSVILAAIPATKIGGAALTGNPGRVGTAGATINFTLSDSSTNFTKADIVVSAGSLSTFTGSGSEYTATFSPRAGFNGTATISVAANLFDNGVNSNAATVLMLAIDQRPPSVRISSDKRSLKAGETATITFTLSENISLAAANDTVTGGTLGTVAGTGLVRTATFTPTPAFTGQAGISIQANRIQDDAGNTNLSDAFAPPLSIDTAVLVVLTVALASDTGISASDTITNNGTLAIGNQESGAQIQYSTNSGTTWTRSFRAARGSNTVDVRQIDRAGNASQRVTLAFTLLTGSAQVLSGSGPTLPAAPGSALDYTVTFGRTVVYQFPVSGPVRVSTPTALSSRSTGSTA